MKKLISLLLALTLCCMPLFCAQAEGEDAAQEPIQATIFMEDGGEMPGDEKLETYLELAAMEMLSWKYHLIGGVPEDVTAVPARDEPTQIYAVVAGYTHAGSEGQSDHVEGGITRRFMYEDMLGYIRNHVLPYVRVGDVK
jgi:hypothetical protein